MLQPAIPTVAVTAVRTGVGKSQTTRAVAATLKEAGKKVVAVRHPMPYGDLTAQRVQRFAELEDLDRHHCTIEEREEYEPHIASGTVIYAGVDYAAILEQAQAEGDVLAVGRWQQRPPVLPAGRPHRARRPAPGRPRDAVPPRGGEPPSRRRDPDQQDGFVDARAGRAARGDDRGHEPDGDGREGELEGDGGRPRCDRRQAGARDRGRSHPHARRDEDRRRRGGCAALRGGRDRGSAALGGGDDRRDVREVRRRRGPARDGLQPGPAGRDGEDHRRGRCRPGRDRHADRSAPRDRHHASPRFGCATTSRCFRIRRSCSTC